MSELSPLCEAKQTSVRGTDWLWLRAPRRRLTKTYRLFDDLAPAFFGAARVETETEDDFIRYLPTFLIEKRLALAVKQPLALITGTMP
jgi:hypothetical protein